LLLSSHPWSGDSEEEREFALRGQGAVSRS
jgi:hypothetical protein